MTKTQFRIAVILPAAIAGLAFIADLAGESSLPVPLQEHLDSELAGDITLSQLVILALALPIVGGGLAAFFGMLRFRPHSRSLGIAVSLVSLVLYPLWGPTVEPGLATALRELSSLLYGAVIAISYFPPVSDWFDEKRQLTPKSEDVTVIE